MRNLPKAPRLADGRARIPTQASAPPAYGAQEVDQPGCHPSEPRAVKELVWVPFCSREGVRRWSPETPAPRAIQKQVSFICPLNWEGQGSQQGIFLYTLSQCTCVRQGATGSTSHLASHSSEPETAFLSALRSEGCRADSAGSGFSQHALEPEVGPLVLERMPGRHRLACPGFSCCWSPLMLAL